jgi:hypothetical protein
MELTLKLEIGLRPQIEGQEEGAGSSNQSLELTEEDLRILRSMKISFEPGV